MRRSVIAASIVVSLLIVDSTAPAAPRGPKVKAAIARRTAPVKAAFRTGVSNLQRLRATRAQRRDRHRGQALADVQRHGRTRIRSVGDLLYSPALHGAVAFAGMLSIGMKGGMALLAGGLVYASSRSAKKTSDGWLRLENRSMDVLEREGPQAAADRFRHMGARDPAASVKRLQKNRHLRNASYE
jgi:hypothetical protein